MKIEDTKTCYGCGGRFSADVVERIPEHGFLLCRACLRSGIPQAKASGDHLAETKQEQGDTVDLLKKVLEFADLHLMKMGGSYLMSVDPRNSMAAWSADWPADDELGLTKALTALKQTMRRGNV